MSKRIWKVIGVVALLGLAGTALAGVHGSQVANVDLSSHAASGSFSSTHNSSDSTAWLNCQNISFSGASPTVGFCLAQDARGTFASCSTTDTKQIASIQGISDSSRVEFQWDKYGVCTLIRVDHDSQFSARTP